MFARTSLLLLGTGLLLALAGCSSGDTGRARGYTACGDFGGSPVECQPGQYCSDTTFSDCTPGCTSDQNCDDAQTCVKPTGESVGDCQNTVVTPARDAGPPPVLGHDAGPPANTLIEDCRGACMDAGLFCETDEITAPEVAACQNWCGDSLTSDTDRQTFVSCIEAALFDPTVCAEAACFP